MLIGHDWGANAGYGAVSYAPAAFRRFVSLAVPPTAALGAGLFSYPQLKRSFYIWFIQQVGLADAVLLQDGFWEGLWADWSPGYDAGADIANCVVGSVPRRSPASSIPIERPSIRSSPIRDAEAKPPPRWICRQFRRSTCTDRCDGAIGAELSRTCRDYFPAPGSAFEMVDGVGHFLHLEQPDEVWRRINAWLAD